MLTGGQGITLNVIHVMGGQTDDRWANSYQVIQPTTKSSQLLLNLWGSFVSLKTCLSTLQSRTQ